MSKEQIEAMIDGMAVYTTVSEIEKQTGMPPTTLQKFLSGKRGLPKKWHKVLDGYFKSGVPKVQNLNKPTNQVNPITNPPETTNKAINTSQVPPMPQREDFKDSWEFLAAKNEWKKKYGV